MVKTPVPGHQWPEYARAVWDEFTRRSGRSERFQSPAEWWLLRGWLLDGIPLRVVLRAMEDTRKGALSLTYYGPSVRDEWERQRLAIGGTR